jgi:acyl-CoA thioesterase
MVTLSDASTPAAVANGFHLDVPAGWRQGRGAFGGLTIAAMIRAIEQRIGDPMRKVRSVTAELFAPVEVGGGQIDVDVLRAGNSVTVARASIAQHGEPKTHAVAIAAATRRGAGPLAWQDYVRPQVPPWGQVETSSVGTPGGPWPEFAQHFEYRVVEGMPMAGGNTARCVGWVRPRQPGEARDAGYIATMVDAWWPAAIVRFTAMRPIATIAYTLDIVAGVDGLAPDAPLLYRGTVPVCADGYFLETRELWGEDGRLVAVNQQTFAII